MSIDDMPQPILSAPPDAKDLKLICPAGHEFPPPWNKRLPFEYTPLLLNIEDGSKRLFAPASVHVPCPNCRAETEISFPQVEANLGHITLYGDESYHWSARGRFTYVYAFVGATPRGKKALEEAMRCFKKTVRPDVEPDWTFHTADVRSSRWREKHGVRVSIDEELRKLAESLAKNQDERFVFVCAHPATEFTLPRPRRKTEIALRDRTLFAALLVSTARLTQQGFSPSFVLEQVGNSTSAEYMDHYVERIGRSLFCSLPFLYSSRCKYVGLPTTSSKMATAELEYADFLAYWTNRYFARLEARRPLEVPLEAFGIVEWAAFTPSRFGLWPAEGFPLHTFYPQAPAIPPPPPHG